MGGDLLELEDGAEGTRTRAEEKPQRRSVQRQKAVKDPSGKRKLF